MVLYVRIVTYSACYPTIRLCDQTIAKTDDSLERRYARNLCIHIFLLAGVQLTNSQKQNIQYDYRNCPKGVDLYKQNITKLHVLSCQTLTTAYMILTHQNGISYLDENVDGGFRTCSTPNTNQHAINRLLAEE